MGISCSAVSATVKTEIAWRERETVRKRARDLLRICAGEGEIEMRKSKRNREAKRRESRSAKRGAKYFAGNWRVSEQDRYPWVLAARRLMERCCNGIKTEIARRERGTARKRARDLLRICAGRERSKCRRARETEKQSGGKTGARNAERNTLQGISASGSKIDTRGIGRSQTYGDIRNGIKTEIAWRERETARKRARDLRHICAGECVY